MDNVGSTRYLVNFHDGVKTHRDGSPFYDIRLFSNKRKRNQFLAQLRRDGYTEQPRHLYR
jgi:hypothetical protein